MVVIPRRLIFFFFFSFCIFSFLFFLSSFFFFPKSFPSLPPFLSNGIIPPFLTSFPYFLSSSFLFFSSLPPPPALFFLLFSCLPFSLPFSFSLLTSLRDKTERGMHSLQTPLGGLHFLVHSLSVSPLAEASSIQSGL